MPYFLVKAEIEISPDTEGKKGKKDRVQFLVDAHSVTEAEARTVKFLSADCVSPFDVKSASLTKISEVLTEDAPVQ